MRFPERIFLQKPTRGLASIFGKGTLTWAFQYTLIIIA
jgi:hypothetical protein